MLDVSGNSVSENGSEVSFKEDCSGTETETKSEETEEGTEKEAEEVEKIENSFEEGTNNTSVLETVEGEEIENEGQYISETISLSNDNLSNTQDYTNYFTFLIAVVLGLGAVICWAKGFTE